MPRLHCIVNRQDPFLTARGAAGGLNATFISSWAHVTIIYIAMLIFLWKVYAGPSQLGSTDQVWNNLAVAAEKNPVKWNYQGSYLTMWSTQGIIFGIINIIGNFGTVFCDQSYWQGAIAARPSATYKGYLLGGISWFSIPFTMATTLGLCGRALDLPITSTESGNGLVPPAVATHLLGQGGSFLVLLQLFMAVTASAASEQIAISSIFSYDIYKRYINPLATGTQIVVVARCGIVFWACISGVLSIILYELNIGLGWVYLAMGNFIGSAVIPVAFALTWRNCSAAGAMLGTWLGAGFSMLGWCLCAQRLGAVNVLTLGDNFSMLTGNLIALFFAPIITVIVSLIAPQNFNWEDMRKRTEEFLILDDILEKDQRQEDVRNIVLALGDEELVHHTLANTDGTPATPQQTVDQETKEELDKVLAFSYRFGGGLSVVLIIIWPLLALCQPVFTKSYWGWWVAIAFIWGHCAAAICIVYPLYQARSPPHPRPFTPSFPARKLQLRRRPASPPLGDSDAQHLRDRKNRRRCEAPAGGRSRAPCLSEACVWAAGGAARSSAAARARAASLDLRRGRRGGRSRT